MTCSVGYRFYVICAVSRMISIINIRLNIVSVYLSFMFYFISSMCIIAAGVTRWRRTFYWYNPFFGFFPKLVSVWRCLRFLFPRSSRMNFMSESLPDAWRGQTFSTLVLLIAWYLFIYSCCFLLPTELSQPLLLADDTSMTSMAWSCFPLLNFFIHIFGWLYSICIWCVNYNTIISCVTGHYVIIYISISTSYGVGIVFWQYLLLLFHYCIGNMRFYVLWCVL